MRDLASVGLTKVGLRQRSFCWEPADAATKYHIRAKMNPTPIHHIRRAGRRRAAATGLMASLAFSALLGASAQADMYRQAPRDGGVNPRSTITSISQDGTNVTLTWYGPQGTYFIEAAPLTSPTAFTRVGQTISSAFAGSYTILGAATNSQVFRVVNYNGYVGQGGCAGCHGDKYEEWQTTAHSTAYNTIASFGNASCFPCHTVGSGEIGGFVDPVSTPHLKNVGCENCHGPAGAHKYGDHAIVHPAVSIDPAICGGCHRDDHHPTLEEYETTLHAEVNDDIKYGVGGGVYYPDTVVVNGTTLYGYYVTTNANGTLKTNATTGIINSGHVPGGYDPGNDRQASCGVCHSGATRMAMLEDYEARQNGTIGPLVLPAANDSASWGPTCAVCHDPHEKYNTAQLRNPTRSTNYFTMPTTTDKRTVISFDSNGQLKTNYVYYNSTFAAYYDENIQVCGQCHNTRGGRWDGRTFGLVTNASGVTVSLTTNVSFSRPPHHSPQYNLLIGIIQPDYLTTNSAGVATNFIARHGIGVSSTSGIYNTNQCATCHMPSYTKDGIVHTGHTFALDTNGCALGGCHTRGVPDIEEFQTETTNSITAVVSLLSQWATNKGPALFGANYSKYKENSWEFTTIGGLAPLTNAGPSSADQLKIPNNIKQARFNTYIVFHDGSLGVHNPRFAPFLLTDAAEKVKSEFALANFKAIAAAGVVPFTVTFTNLGTGATSYSWSFGDGGTSTDPNPSHTYTSAGVYTVSLTATGPSGSETLTLKDYITVANPPVADFTAAPTSGPAPLIVYFTNLSANATAYTWTFGDGKTSTTTSPVNTYTNAGTYTVTLSARNLGVTNTVTRTGYISVTP